MRRKLPDKSGHRIRRTRDTRVVTDTHRKTVRDGYDTIAERYLDERVTGGDMLLLPELVSRLAPHDAVLDAGCGAGVPVRTQLGLAQSLVAGTDLVQADLAALPFRDGSFAGVVSFYSVIHVPRATCRS